VLALLKVLFQFATGVLGFFLIAGFAHTCFCSLGDSQVGSCSRDGLGFVARNGPIWLVASIAYGAWNYRDKFLDLFRR